MKCLYNLIEYSNNYSITSQSLWNYYRDEANSGTGGADSDIDYSINDLKSFDYKTNMTVKLEDGDNSKKMLKLLYH